MSKKNNLNSNNKKTTKAKNTNSNNINSINKKNSFNKNQKYIDKGIKKSNRFLSLLLNIALIIAVCYASILTLKYFFPLKDYDVIKTYSEVNGLNEALVCAVINVESGFDTYAVSNKGASGYMQLMEQTATWGIETLGIENVNYDDIFDAELNIALGTWYLANLYRQFGSEDLAIISYNAGSGNVTRWLNSNDGNIEETLKNIPYEETKNYYFKVKTNEYVYKFLLKYIYN